MIDQATTKKEFNITAITSKLIGLVLGLDEVKRRELLRELEEKDMNISVVTTRLVKKILSMPLEDRQIYLRKLEDQIDPKNRKNKRKSYFMDVDFSVNKRIFKGYIQNISTDGIFIETKESFTQGQEIIMSFMLPGSGEHVKIKGKVARFTPQGIGIVLSSTIDV